MSYHDDLYLNAGNILVGGVQGLKDRITGEPLEGGWRRPAWWYNPRLEDIHNPTHYPNYLPISLVKEKLFGWTALESAKLVAHVEIDGRMVEIDCGNFKAIVRGDRVWEDVPADSDGNPIGNIGNPESVLSIMSKDYEALQPQESFIQTTVDLLQGSDNVGITGAGLLKWGRVCYMEVSIPQTMHNDRAGFDYRPNLLIYTSFDGSLKYTIARTITATVCDNTLAIAASEAKRAGTAFQVAHTRLAREKMSKAREVLGILEQETNEMDELLNTWAATPVNPKQFEAWLDEVLPVPEVKVIDGKAKTNSQTIVLNKREAIGDLYYSDERAATWVGTKLGVRQAWNTAHHHKFRAGNAKQFGGNKMQARVEANMMRAMRLDKNGDSEIARSDAWAMEKLDLVLSNS
ncbi:gp57 [Mycobacterium phage Konstantine]|uniref:Uncharacterized protein n=1 Tax=Mycobacterium phage Konstantine TaxID=563121 RepID=B5U527_9CAUD|nr:gp57 [Mycobacterium phage Konstantine]ACI12473.1 hypothetical protein KONSTANTINE_57 [Mycobacterium phage Konstantine]